LRERMGNSFVELLSEVVPSVSNSQHTVSFVFLIFFSSPHQNP